MSLFDMIRLGLILCLGVTACEDNSENGAGIPTDAQGTAGPSAAGDSGAGDTAIGDTHPFDTHPFNDLSTDSAGMSDPDSDGVGFNIVGSVSDKIGTVGVVEWSTNVEAEIDAASISFGLDTNYGAIAPVDLNQPNFRTLLLGLKGQSEYHFQVEIQAGGQTYKSEDHTINTGPAINISPPTVFVQQPDKLAGGFLVMASYVPVSFVQNPMAFILDADGEIVWWYKTQSLVDSTKACVSYDGNYVAVVSSNNQGANGAVEIVSLDHEDVRVFDNLTGATHDITPVPGNRFAFLDVSPDGNTFMTSVCARVVELSLDGTTEVIFDTADVWGTSCHGNAIRYSETEGLYTVSDYEHSEIVAFDRNGTVAWVTKNNGTWEYQHGHQILEDSLLIFNNGGDYASGNPQSHVLEFSFNNSNGALSEIWRYSASGLGSPSLGDVQRLPNGNTLVAYSNKAIIHEVDPEGNRVQVLDLGQTAFGYVVWRQSMYGPPDDLKL